MKTALELFFVTLVDGGFHYVRREINLTEERRDPDVIATEYLSYFFADSRVIAEKHRYILHSTSWRYEYDGKILLTYLVYADAFSFTHLNPGFIALDDLKIIESHDPKIPRPKNITLKAVVAHGIRHLAFLIQYDEKKIMHSVIGLKTIEQFYNLHIPQLAGKSEYH